ncbi:hypothetical protein Q8F55_005076 [Vanrija albida]|uniref:Uncharacterized protein n=1 Tax=Vanrija albida TaxID=181172 RepID=A0ABR3Q0L5_9TREE
MLALALLALTLAAPALAEVIAPPGPPSGEYIFAGCVDDRDLDPAALGGYGTIDGLQPNECETYLSSLPDIANYAYAYWVPPNNLTPMFLCFASNTFYPRPSVGWMSYDGSGQGGVHKEVDAAGRHYSWEYAGCYEETAQSDPPPYAGSFLNADPSENRFAQTLPGTRDKVSCLAGCATALDPAAIDAAGAYSPGMYGFAVWFVAGSPEIAALGANCICAAGPINGVRSVCEDPAATGPAPTRTFVYAAAIPEFVPEPSGAPARRRAARRAQLALLEKQRHAFCPPGLRPCRVERGEGYECVDVTSELGAWCVAARADKQSRVARAGLERTATTPRPPPSG